MHIINTISIIRINERPSFRYISTISTIDRREDSEVILNVKVDDKTILNCKKAGNVSCIDKIGAGGRFNKIHSVRQYEECSSQNIGIVFV